MIWCKWHMSVEASSEWHYKYFLIYSRHKSSEVYFALVLSHPLTALGTRKMVLLLGIVWRDAFGACWLTNISVMSVFRRVRRNCFSFYYSKVIWWLLIIFVSCKIWISFILERDHSQNFVIINMKGKFCIRNTYLNIIIQLDSGFWLLKYVSFL